MLRHQFHGVVDFDHRMSFKLATSPASMTMNADAMQSHHWDGVRHSGAASIVDRQSEDWTQLPTSSDIQAASVQSVGWSSSSTYGRTSPSWRLLTSSGCGHAGSAECIKEKPWTMSRCRTRR